MLPNSTLLYRPAIIELVFELFAQRMPLSQRGHKMGDFGKLLEEQIPRLRRYARALTRNAPIADDLIHECLMRAVANSIFGNRGPICGLGYSRSSIISTSILYGNRATMAFL